jgi:hypothetical protein
LKLNEAFGGDGPNRIGDGVSWGGNSRQRNLLPLAGSSFSSFEVFEDVLGGTAASHASSGVGGGHFLITK